jgi:hypothetical protein
MLLLASTHDDTLWTSRKASTPIWLVAQYGHNLLFTVRVFFELWQFVLFGPTGFSIVRRIDVVKFTKYVR